MGTFVNLPALDREVGYLDHCFSYRKLAYLIKWNDNRPEYTMKKPNGITIFQSFLSKRQTSNSSESILCFRDGMFGLKQSRRVHLSLIAFCMTRFICLNLLQTKRHLVKKPGFSQCY